MTVIQCVVITLFALTTFYMLSALELVKVRENKYVYQIGGLTAFVVTFNILMLLYVVRLIAGIHFMIVSGSVSSWFFTRYQLEIPKLQIKLVISETRNI